VVPAVRRWVVFAAITGLALAVLSVLNPQLLLRATTPTGGDMGAHVFGPAYLRETLLPQGRILGWSNSWFAGFPAFYFYFPLPSLVIVALDLVLPYGVAFKLVTVVGLLALPAAAYFLARSLTLGRGVSLVTAGASTSLVFMESYSIYGGNVASTLAGEFSYSWSFALGLVYLGLLIRAIHDDRRYLPWAAAVLAATALSHVLTTLVLVIASIPALIWKGAQPVAVRVWGWGFAIAGFWALPLLARIGYTSDMAWTPLSRTEELFPLEIWLLMPLAVGGAVWITRRTRRAAPLVIATLIPVIYYPLPTWLPELIPSVFDGGRWKLWNGRLLPYWYFGVAFFAGIGLGVAVAAIARRLPERISAWWPRGVVAGAGLVAVVLMVQSGLPVWAPVAVGAAVAVSLGISLVDLRPVSAAAVLSVSAAALMGLGALAGVNYVDGWSRWNYEGYEAKEPWPEYRGLMETLAGLPPGRVQWEANRELDKYGTPMAPMLIPYWTDYEQYPSMEGLFFESSLTTPFHFINAGEMSFRPSNPIPGLPYSTFDFDRGIPHLEHFGVRYYVSFTPEAATKAESDVRLRKVAESPPFAIFEVPPTELVEVARYQPAVFEPAATAAGPLNDAGAPAYGSYEDAIVDWYANVSVLDRWLAEDGPDSWPRASSWADLPDIPLPVAASEIRDVELTDHRLSFRTEAVGVPHLVKVSYFPNWQATGAEGPWLAAPSLMVVVPTENEVVLEFRNTWAEWLGWLLTVGGLAALGVTAWRRTRRPEEAPV
jgi:hypothetical protein